MDFARVIIHEASEQKVRPFFLDRVTRRFIMKSMIALLIALLTFGFGAVLTSQAGTPMDKMTEKNLGTMPSSDTFRTLDGKLLKIDGEYYVIEDYEGREKRLHVSKETLMLNGPKQPGDSVRVEITKTGHAVSIQ